MDFCISRGKEGNMSSWVNKRKWNKEKNNLLSEDSTSPKYFSLQIDNPSLIY